MLIYKVAAAQTLEMKVGNLRSVLTDGSFFGVYGWGCLALWKLHPFSLLLSYHFPSLVPGD